MKSVASERRPIVQILLKFLHREVVLRNNNQGKKYASNVARCITLSMFYCSESLEKSTKTKAKHLSIG